MADVDDQMWAENVARYLERDHTRGDPLACVRAYVHAHDYGQAIPEWCVAPLNDYLRHQLSLKNTPLKTKAAKAYQDSITAAAIRAVRDIEPARSQRAVAEEAWKLLSACPAYTRCYDDPLDGIPKFMVRHSCDVAPCSYWLTIFKLQLDPACQPESDECRLDPYWWIKMASRLEPLLDPT